MRRKSGYWFGLGLLLSSLFLTALPARAQTELDITSGWWVPILPDYRAGSLVDGGNVLESNIFHDDQTSIGRSFGLKGFYAFENAPCHMLEGDLNFAFTGNTGATTTFADPGPTSSVWYATLDGLDFISTGSGENAVFSLDSDTIFYSGYLGYRKRVCTSKGPLDIGAGFSYFAFEQDFVMNSNFNNELLGQYVEGLDTDFFGAEVRSTYTSPNYKIPLLFDCNVGFFGMNSNYEGRSGILDASTGAPLYQASESAELNDFAFTLDVGVRGEKTFCDVLYRPGIAMKYISAMPQIEHPQSVVSSGPVELSKDRAFILQSTLEIML